MKKFSIAILAGGMSRRFGSDKSFAYIGDKTFLERIVEISEKLTDDIIIVSKSSEKFSTLKTIRLVEDILPIQTPLVGILTALCNTKYDNLFVWSVDSPLTKPEIIKIIVDEMSNTNAAIPEIYGKIHPLIASYERSIMEKLKAFLQEGGLKVTDFLSKISVTYVKEDKFLHIDPDMSSFCNFNTQKDLQLYESNLKNKIQP